ncbi:MULTISPECIES: glycosyltransferase [unclassified Rhizobacter]|uniref:glycosyltransferase n=1 Tax=unclassified Rhizobacter TaxID=2640088 RepID=UPI0006FF45A8|nr:MULTISPECIES: glycosyltransferase [unclassified Rhizobacter]KQU74856.1 hypothetical protein ASC88_25905 [Rhizobacter sp. Root29]KQW01069.1 hypothetical protein ASC98_07060 [Rhizobacter sp. Root1238]KRB03919.1 hypothetical protein ASE08_14565 [Rhizobacter sp. Root16D2]
MTRKFGIITSNLFFAEVFLARQIRSFEKEFDLTVVINCNEAEYRRGIGGNARFLNVALERKISPWRDLCSLISLTREFRRNKYTLVHSTTPKAGLLAMIAGRLAGVPIRIHTFTGQVWQTRSGFMRWMLKATDKLTTRCATTVLVDGHNQLSFLIDHGVLSPAKGKVIGNGSICGVDTNKFAPSPAHRTSVRHEIGAADDEVLLVYMARLTVDKGALLMAQAFTRLCEEQTIGYRLLMIGPDEENLTDLIRTTVGKHVDRLHMLGYTRTPERYIAAADIFCLPSYREGFPMVLLNAAACAVPALAARIHGSTDAIEDNATGLLHDSGDLGDMVQKIRTLAGDASLRARLGEAARARVMELYAESVVTGRLRELYEQLIREWDAGNANR